MTSHMLVQGDFLRASLYFGRLTVVTYSGGVDRYHVPTLSSTRQLDDGAIRTFAERTSDPADLATERTDSLGPPSDSEILLLHSYDGATYVGARDGLWAMPEPTDTHSGRVTGYAHLVDRPALDVDTAFGVAVVAHGDGISVLPLNSSWLADEYFRPSRDESVAHLHAVTWTHHDIIGRLAPFIYEVIPAEFELKSRDEVRHYVFQGLGTASPFNSPDEDLLISAVASRSFAAWNDASNRSTLFAKQRTGWSSHGSSTQPDSDQEPQFRALGSVQGRVISLQEFGRYLVCELSDRLSIVDNAGTESVLLDRAATDVRAYPRSRRYRGILTAVSEVGVHVLEPGRVGG